MPRLTIFLLLIQLTVHAADDKNTVTAHLRSATVYRSGAELVHTAKTTLAQGNNELIIDNISNRIDLNSLQIGSNGQLTILSMEFTTNFLKPEKKLAVVKKLEDSLEVVDKELSAIQVVLKTDEDLLDLLKKNKEIRGQQTGVSVAELAKMMEYYKTKTLELQNEIAKYNEREAKLLDLKSRINQQIKEEEQKNSKTVGRLQLQVYCPIAGNYDLNISYVTPLAWWKPSYDLRIESVSKPVSLLYKAKLVQTSGIDWQQVKLSLSTSTPSQHNHAPDVKSWFLSYSNPRGGLEEALSGKLSGVMPERPMDEVVVMGYGGVKSKVEDDNQEPIYVVNGNTISATEFKKIDKRAIKKMDVLKDGQATAIYGSRANNGAVVVTLKEDLGDYVDVKDNELNVVFDIELPYDVPTNGKEQHVQLKDFKVPSNYKYYAAPRLDRDAYLLGGLTEWAGLNLIPGEANIIFEGTYIGKTAINPGTTMDTLNLTLGRDKRVVVKREKLSDFSSVKFLGSNKKQTFTYEITVRNNKKEKINMDLRDQYPLSTNKDIEVELLQHDNANVNAETGVLTWKMELAPGETKKLRLSYSVKYPKDREINLN